MEKNLIILIMLIILASHNPFAQENSDEKNILGEWVTNKKERVLEIYKENGKYYGRISKILNQESNDNSKVKQGMIILRDLVYEDGVFTDGEIYAAKRDSYFSAEIKMLERDRLELTVSAFMISRSVEWTRYKE
ncbi:MAG: DUF2147 domain-containing protein [Rhodothermaceae bacterium]